MSAVFDLVGLFVLVIALIGLVRRRVGWARIASRGQAGFVLAGGVALLAVGGAMAPAAHTTVAPQPPTESISASPSPSITIPAQRAPAAVETTAPVHASAPAPVQTAAPMPVQVPVPAHISPVAPAPPPATIASGGETYTNVDGNQVSGPVQASSRPAGSTAQCNDGTYSFSQHHRGTCSSHGGVAQFYQ